MGTFFGTKLRGLLACDVRIRSLLLHWSDSAGLNGKLFEGVRNKKEKCHKYSTNIIGLEIYKTTLEADIWDPLTILCSGSYMSVSYSCIESPPINCVISRWLGECD